ARGLRRLAGSWRRTRGGCPLLSSVPLGEREGCWQRRIAATVQASCLRWLAGSWRGTRGGSAVVLEARSPPSVALAGSWRLTRGGCPRWCSRRAACGGCGGQLEAYAWWLPPVVLEARGLRWLAGSWRRTSGGCPRWCSRRAACGGWRAAGGARVAATRGGARGTVAAIRSVQRPLRRRGCWQRDGLAATVQARWPAVAAGSWRAHTWRLPA
ncbi:unnamed protein product, partial [Prorocentrum cordatum]